MKSAHPPPAVGSLIRARLSHLSTQRIGVAGCSVDIRTT